MSRPPYVIAGLTAGAGLVWMLRMGLRPAPLAQTSGALVGFTLVLGAVIATAGMLLGHGRWSRRLGLVLAAAQLALAVVLPLDWIAAAALVATAAALTGLAGPWLDDWLRLRPPADAPHRQAVITALGLLALPGVVGAAAPGGVGASQWVLAAAGLVLGWGYAAGGSWALWGTRLGLAPLATWAAWNTAPPGAVVMATVPVVIVIIAWSRPARLAVRPLLDRIPPPRSLGPKPRAIDA